MADADASASFELEDDSLSAGLDAIAAKFAAIASQINGSFAAANAQLTGTAAAAQAVGAAAPAATGVARALTAAATAGRIVATAFGGVVTTATRLAPLVRYLPDSLGSWMPKVKQVAGAYTHLASTIGLVTKSAAALTGRLTVLQAGFGALELRELGASRAAAVFGAAAALAMSKTIAGARAATSVVGSLAATLARTAGGMGGKFAGAVGGIGRSLGGATMVLAPMAGLALALGPVGAAALGVAAGFSAVKKSIASASEVQTLQMSFVTLLGSADAARKRMAELSKFAASTPFEIPGVTRASKVLETLTKGALSTGSGLRLVGDAAAVSGEPVEALAVHIGRLYDGLMNGRAVGESLMRLQELGLVSATTRGRIEDLQKAGEKGGAVWSVAAGDLARFSGEMQRQSGTWAGLLSNASDAVGNLFRAFGAPVITALTPFLQRLIAWLGSLTTWAEKAGSVFAGWSALIAQIFADGKMGEALARVGKVAFMEAVNLLYRGLVGAGNAFAAYIAGAVKSFLVVLSHAATAEFWSGLGNALMAAGVKFVALLQRGLASVLEKLADVPGIGGRAGAAARQLRGAADANDEGAKAFAADAGANLAPLFRDLTDNIARTVGEMAKSFGEGFSGVGDLFDADGAKAELMEFIRPIAQAAQTAVNAAARAAERGGLPSPIGTTGDADAGGKKSKSNDVASLQRIGGGGGFSISRADPLLAETRNQTGELKAVRGEIKALREAVTNRRPGAGAAVFG